MDDDLRKEFEWLFSSEGKTLVAQVETDFLNRKNALSINKTLRKKTTPVRAAILIEQAQLRLHGLSKFVCADQMFFTRRGLEQATSLPIARYKATRFKDIKNVADICCGIGGDLIALAARRVTGVKTVGIDSDELTAAIAGHNLAGVGIFDATVAQQDFEVTDLSRFDGIHIDPDRRMKSRTVRGDFFQPKLPDIYQRIGDHQTVAIKVAPATPLHVATPKSVQREWIGDQRECKQQVLWTGPKTLKPRFTTATLVANSGQVFTYSADSKRVGQPRLPSALEIGAAIYEPHAVVLASGLMSSLAQDVGLRPVSEHADYLTGSLLQKTPLLTEYKIVEMMKLDLRQISAVLKRLNVGELIVKKRGVEHEIYNQLSRLKVSGDNRATIIATRHLRRRVALITNVTPRS